MVCHGVPFLAAKGWFAMVCPSLLPVIYLVFCYNQGSVVTDVSVFDQHFVSIFCINSKYACLRRLVGALVAEKLTECML
jgi:hypothetical protein